jgi:hypothetical protein
VIPIGFFWTGDQVVVCTAATAPKVAVDGVPAEYLAGAGKSFDDEARAAFEQTCRQMYDQMARIAITPSWARYYHYSTGRAPQFLVDLAAKNLT